MSDERFEYVDEDGNPVDPSELGDEYEVVDEVEPEQVEAVDYLDEFFDDADDEVPELELDGEQSVPVVADDEPEPVELIEIDQPIPTPVTEPEPVATTATATAPVEPEEAPGISLNGRGKLVLVGAAAAVAVVVGGLAFGLSALGNENTAADVADYGRGKASQASEVVASKSSEVRGEVASEAIDTCRVGKLSGPGGLGDAMATGAETPKLRLDVVSAAPLPGAFIAASGPNADGTAGKTSLLQLTKTSWGVYVTTPLTKAERKAEVERPAFHKADVQVDNNQIRVTGDRVWAGGDQGGAGSCEPGKPGVYAAQGQIPADAAGLVDDQASVTAIQGIAGEPSKAVAVMGNSVALVRLVEAEPEGGGEASSSSPVPSK